MQDVSPFHIPCLQPRKCNASTELMHLRAEGCIFTEWGKADLMQLPEPLFLPTSWNFHVPDKLHVAELNLLETEL